ncbi:FadR/GntR family transcriptional regulator [Aureliella helgolandensis]|uniref:HTH-type transcriptional regulator LutR n=1 Tax=Aureliella helgolandensis TaxID=2527968 RepID=A0A518G2Z8_9BACT|nr:FadR/GntR family transcriptional regulator [Aureliella helgolandensis]QDV22935.1 HTH-type transcriptional regulator LutR [Aureliella helgolandensis]
MVSSTTSTETVFHHMLQNVRSGVWETGSTIPSERALIDEFGVSRIAIREALSMLRGLGVVDIGHGRRTRVKSIDSETLGYLLPLMLSSGGQRTFDQVFEVRLAIESQTVALAARRRTDAHLGKLEILLQRFRQAMTSADAEAQQIDLEFHLEIARAADNPLFPVLLEALAGFVAFAQKESCRNDSDRSQRAILAHESIVEAIRDSDTDRARVEMESHLRYSMTRKIQPNAS